MIPLEHCATVVVNHLLQVVSAVAMEAPAGGDAATLKDAKYAVLRSMADGTNRLVLRARPVRRLPAMCPAWTPSPTTETYAALKTRDRQLALGRRSVLRPHRQADADQADRGADGVQSGRPKVAFLLGAVAHRNPARS